MKKAQIFQKINFVGPKICIKSGFCNEPKIANISHCAKTDLCGEKISRHSKLFWRRAALKDQNGGCGYLVVLHNRTTNTLKIS